MKESLLEILARLEKKVDSLEAELAQIKATVKDKIKPVIIDIKPAKSEQQLTKEDVIRVISEQPKPKVMAQLNTMDIEKAIINTVTLTYVNNLYGRNK